MAGERKLDVDIFMEALQLPNERRIAYLEQACAGDADQRRHIEALLKANDRAGEFLEAPPTGSIKEIRHRVTPGEKPGDRIDRYTLLRQIGEGGCGIVFLAEQQKPVLRRVALKLIKPGMDSKGVIARFEAERQALALMDHPNIAHVFDAGATESGRPYFVMELVDGLKITDYCQKHSLPIAARLKLFMQVCNAIQHAHQKGIIHRDIKPSNILVGEGSEGQPVPKVIDFGIAKAIGGQQLTDKTIVTAHEMLIGTPAYMSPEQAALTSVDVDTRTDIYSLGVLLYELLTNTTPFDTRELLKAGFDEIRRVIRDEEPVRPSTRLSTMLTTSRVKTSGQHKATAPKLIREMRGDLDWIVMHAMDKDRVRRYPTANGLAMDVHRYLGGEAIVARPPSSLYKIRKLIVRNKLLYASLAIIFILLAAGLAVTIRLLIVERQRNELAQNQQEVYRLEGLGVAQWAQGHVDEGSRSFRRAFALRRQFLAGQPPPVAVAAVYVQMLGNKSEEAVSVLGEFPKAQLYSTPGYVTLLGDLAIRASAMKGRWKDATNDLAHVVKSQPDFPKGYHAFAPLLVACGAVLEYRSLCRQIIEHFNNTQDPSTADQMAKDCLILPDSGANLNTVGVMANVAVTKGTNNSSYPLFQTCKALAEYRQEHFAEALKWAGSAAKDSFPYSKAESFAILAMAQFRSGQTNLAFAALSDCTTVIEQKLPKLSSGDLGQDWRDWIIAHSLQSEAKRLIVGESSGAGFPPNL